VSGLTAAGPASAFVEKKARRLLAEGRVRAWCDETGLRVLVLGDHDVYHIHVTVRGLSCPCPSRRRDCSHAIAAERIAGRA